MKKSDMIKELATAIILYDVSINYKKAQELAEETLGVSIKLGMKAPQIESAFKKYGFNVYRENNYWEPEDD